MDSFAGNVQAPQTFQMPDMPQAAGGAMGNIKNLQKTYGGLGAHLLPQAQATTQNLYNNPFAGMALGGAQMAAPMGMQAAGAQYGAGMGLIPGASQIMQTGFDPQQALYNRTLQQIQDQVRAGNMAAGVGTTPYGAGIESQAMQNFNIDWQNQQLARQAQAAQAAGQLATTGSGLATGAPGQFAQAAGMPYGAYGGIGQGQMGALGGLLGLGGQGAQLANLPTQDYLSYLGAGNQAGQVANQAFANQLQQANLGWNQLGGLAKGVGSLMSFAPTQGGPTLGQSLWGGIGALV